MFRVKTLVAGIALATLLPFAANASIIGVRDNPDNGASEYLDGAIDSFPVLFEGNELYVNAGVFSLQYQEQGDEFWTDFLSFCLEISTRLKLPNEYSRADASSYFGDEDVRNAIGIIYGNFLTEDLGLKSAQSAAGLQTIIWELVEDGPASFDLTSGRFAVVDTSILSEAETLWALVISGNYNAAEISVFLSENSQDLLTAFVSEVPIPGALLLLMTGFAGLNFASRKGKSAETIA